MDRRSFSKLLAGAVTTASIPRTLLAKSSIGDQRAFQTALSEKPWLLGYLGATETELHGSAKIVLGRVPDDLKGYFLRNGPALHDIGSDRFTHWFDAPGMVQKFTFADGQVRHHGRLIDTARNRREINAGQILFSGFGTHGHGLSSGGSADGQNPANISLLEHAGELLALWEGGSPHIIDSNTLETRGIKSWSAETKGMPFGAHPRVDQDGSLWNVGYSVNHAALILYHVSTDGALLKTHILPQHTTPMIHDFMITQTRIVLVLAPYSAAFDPDSSFVDQFTWRSDKPARVLVIDKNDLSNILTVETDAFWAFHFGNAYDLSPTEIGFDFAHHDTPGFMTHDAIAAMDGSWDGMASSPSRYAQARINLSSKRIDLTTAPELGQTEFIQTDTREKLRQHRYALVLSNTGGKDVYGFNRVLLLDRDTGNASHFDHSMTEILEEHLIVPKPNASDEFWIMGTSLDWSTARTSLSVYDGKHLAHGPILKVELDIPLPLGLHGTFLAF